MAKNAVQYAEQDLGVHEVWEEAQQRLAEHATAKSIYVQALQDIRRLKSEIKYRTLELTTEERGKHPDMKVTEFREHMKVVLGDDDRRFNAEAALESAESDRDLAKQDLDHHDLGMRAITARMEELAGLLHFYSAAKQATAT